MTTHSTNRRGFIKNAALGILGTGAALNTRTEITSSSETQTIRKYRMMGRTGFSVSDFGSGSPSSDAVLKALFERGVNVVDTGEQYGNGNNERLIAGVLKEFERDKIFINCKLYEEKSFKSKKDVIDRTNAALERLETDYVDCMMIHSAESTEILRDKAFHAGMKQLKNEGKVRFTGVSCHGNNHLVDTRDSLDTIMLAAANDGRFDVLQLAYNFFNRDKAEKVLEACESKNIGTQIIKSNPVQLFLMMDDRVSRSRAEGKEPNEYTLQFYEKFKKMTEEGKRFFADYNLKTETELMDAAMKYVLGNDQAHTVLWAFNNFQDIEDILSLSGSSLNNKGLHLLEGYQQNLGKYTCRIGCNECQKACPQHLPVNEIMRYNYYYSVKGRQKEAMEKFARLPGSKPHAVCKECPGYCEEACPYQVETRAILAMAESNLSFA